MHTNVISYHIFFLILLVEGRAGLMKAKQTSNQWKSHEILCSTDGRLKGHLARAEQTPWTNFEYS